MSRPQIRFILGKSQASGFTSFTDGDFFEKDGEVFKLTSSAYGWTLRRTLACDGYRTDYSAPPLEGWRDIPSAMTLVQMINEAQAAVA